MEINVPNTEALTLATKLARVADTERMTTALDQIRKTQEH
jgi:hypothetical protein